MSIAGIGGFLFGGLVGLFLRPVLDSYVEWRQIKAARAATQDDIPMYPFLNEAEERNRWPI